MPAYASKHTIIACPVCSKNGNGRGVIQSYYKLGETGCLYCVFCGWNGDYSTVQSFEFPCLTYTVVEICLSVLENMLSIECQEPIRLSIELPYGTKTNKVLDYVVEDGPIPGYVRPETWNLFDALTYLVGKGWLYPALYKVEVDV